MAPMQTQKITIKATPQALQLLRLIAAHTGEKQYRVLERVLREELRTVEKERKHGGTNHTVGRT
jgi:hypothetical protein